jgi:hypothetical protein
MSEQNKKHRCKIIGWAPGTDKPMAVDVDVYRVLDAFQVKDPAIQHLVKKALVAGERGRKDLIQDYKDIVHSANSALDLLNAKAAEQADHRCNKPITGAFVVEFKFPKLKEGAPSLSAYLEEQGFKHVAHDEWAADSGQLQNMPRMVNVDFERLENGVIAWMGCPGQKTEAILESKLWEGFDPAEAYRQMAKLCEEHGSKGGAKVDTSTPGGDTDAPSSRSHVSTAYLMAAPYGKVPQNHVRLLRHKCPHCDQAVLSPVVPSRHDGQSGYPDASCPHCRGDLAGATFASWNDVEAVFNNMLRVPPEHLNAFLECARSSDAGYRTRSSIRAALRNYYAHVLHGPREDSDAFVFAVWPDLAPKAKAAAWPTLTDKLAGLGVGEGAEVVVSGGCDMKDEITKAVTWLGGVMRASVTPRTKLIIVGDKPGAKLAKAMTLGVNIVFAANLRDHQKDEPNDPEYP